MKQKAKIYKGKRIVIGDKNLVTKNEIHVNDIPQEGGESGGGNSGGGTSVLQPNDVNFYDYDGTLLYSYTYKEACKLKSLPPAPHHDGLVFQEWNYTLDDIKEQGFKIITNSNYYSLSFYYGNVKLNNVVYQVWGYEPLKSQEETGAYLIEKVCVGEKIISGYILDGNINNFEINVDDEGNPYTTEIISINEVIGKADVGANYITDDEATKVVIVPEKALSNVYLYIRSGFYPDEHFSAIGDVIDWGDGIIETISEETKSSWDEVYINHTYQETKEYTVRYWRNNSNVVAGINTITYATLLKVIGFGRNAAVRQIEYGDAELFGFNVPKGSSINISFNRNYIGYIVVPRDFVYYDTVGNSTGYCEGVSFPSTLTTLNDSVFYNAMIEKVILPRNLNVLNGGYGSFALAPIKNFIANGLVYIDSDFYEVFFQQEELYFPVLLEGKFNGSRINTLKVNNSCEYLDGIENVSVLDCRECTFIPNLGNTYKNSYQRIIVPDELYDEWVNNTNWSSLTSKYVKSSLINW